ncbi:MAG: PH domain-containing protein [Maribacter sp.]
MKRYQSAISYGLLVTILIVLIGPLLFLPFNSLVLFINGLILVFVINIFYNTYYIIENEKLLVKSSFVVNKKIEIMSITKISETNSIISSPAASLDRLEIVYEGNNSILISPKDKSAFINDIKKINKDIKIKLR